MLLPTHAWSAHAALAGGRCGAVPVRPADQNPCRSFAPSARVDTATGVPCEIVLGMASAPHRKKTRLLDIQPPLPPAASEVNNSDHHRPFTFPSSRTTKHSPNPGPSAARPTTMTAAPPRTAAAKARPAVAAAAALVPPRPPSQPTCRPRSCARPGPSRRKSRSRTGARAAWAVARCV